MKIKEIALMLGCSEQNIRAMIKTHKKELKGHFLKTRYTELDDEGVEILRQYRARPPMQVYSEKQDKEIEKLKKDLDVKTQLLINTQQELLELQRATTNLQLEYGKTQLLLEASEKETDRLQKQADDLKEELDSFERTIFGFYRKKKSR